MNIQPLIPIDPITKIKTIVYTKMEIKVLNFPLGQNQCEIQVIVYDDAMEYSKSFTYLISGVDYLNWQTDNYIFTYLKSKLKSEIY